jgi:hypothetical protein
MDVIKGFEKTVQAVEKWELWQQEIDNKVQ